MKNTVFLTALFCATLGAVSAQQEAPMFFDKELGIRISEAVFSPDGRIIAVNRDDNAILL
ncbi:MAG: hypothetical protein LBF83_01975 [Spirochaetaceae bacterium]|jgi:hypothetical protein|nr:hypothetical protein [Spirochaetaceae bacterium]